MTEIAPPRLLFWESTKACNLRCRHCRAIPMSVSHDLELSSEEAVNLIRQASELGVRIFVFSGGEPLLRSDIFELMGLARQQGMMVAMATNGTLIDDERAERLSQAGVARVSVSFDGPTDSIHDKFRGVEGSFQRALEGIAALKRAGVPFQINTTVTRDNMHDLSLFIRLVQTQGAVGVHFFFLVPVGCGADIPDEQQVTPEEYEDLLRWFAHERERQNFEMRATCAPHLQRIIVEQGLARPDDGNGCLAGTGILFVGHDGSVQPCGYLPLVVGNVRAESVSQVWESSTELAGFRTPVALSGTCGSCRHRSRCGGCRARALMASGNVFGDEPMCLYGKRQEVKKTPPSES